MTPAPKRQPAMRPASPPSTAGFQRGNPLTERIPRERVVVPASCAFPACGSAGLVELGEHVTETLEVIPTPLERGADSEGEVLLP
jgi:transposase